MRSRRLRRLLGQRTSMTTGGDTTKYRYDAAYQLTEEDLAIGAFTKWEYDAIGNRTSQISNVSGTQTYEYYRNGTNPANSARLKRVANGPILTYDASGNLQNSSTWDDTNRLTQNSSVTFEYDWRFRRTKHLNTKYLYAGENVARVRDTAAGVLDDFSFGNGIDEPLASRDHRDRPSGGTPVFRMVATARSHKGVVRLANCPVTRRTGELLPRCDPACEVFPFSWMQ